MAHTRLSIGWKAALAVTLLLPLLAMAGSARDAPGTTARLHQDRGVSCADCHGKAKTSAEVTTERCLSCHGPVEALVAKTAPAKPVNPHESPHWGKEMDCTVCHRQHEATVNWCAYCHMTTLKVP
jgi:RecJ-like exonuclease